MVLTLNMNILQDHLLHTTSEISNPFMNKNTSVTSLSEVATHKYLENSILLGVLVKVSQIDSNKTYLETNQQKCKRLKLDGN